MQARDKRAKGRLKNNEKQRDEIIAEHKGAAALEVLPVQEIPGMRAAARIVEEKLSAKVVAAIPPKTEPRERHQFWLNLDQRVRAGDELTEDLLGFHKGYANSREHGIWSAYFNNIKHEPDDGSSQTGTL